MKKKYTKSDSMDDNLIYYWKMGGVGTIFCNKCDFNQEIVSFLHGRNWSNTGFQCQNCGKFHEIECDSENSLGKLCDCGGVLSREEPVFCPNCRTTDIRYGMSYIS